MWSLNCDYYTREFETLAELITDILDRGMDPSYEVTRDGRGVGEAAADLIVF